MANSVRVVGSQGTLMHVGIEGCPVWADRWAAVAQIFPPQMWKVLIERSQNTRSITVCRLRGLHSQRPVRMPMLTPVQCRKHGPMEEGSLDCWFAFSLTSCGWPGACASLLGNTTKDASQRRQCDALGNILLWSLESCYPRTCYFDTYHLFKHCCWPSTTFHGNGSLLAVVPFNRIMYRATKQKQEWFKSTTRRLRCWFGFKGSIANIMVPQHDIRGQTE